MGLGGRKALINDVYSLASAGKLNLNGHFLDHIAQPHVDR